jgi:hypothetical protein
MEEFRAGDRVKWTNEYQLTVRRGEDQEDQNQDEE